MANLHAGGQAGNVHELLLRARRLAKGRHVFHRLYSSHCMKGGGLYLLFFLVINRSLVGILIIIGI